MSIRMKRQIVRKNAAISGRQAVADPFRPRPTRPTRGAGHPTARRCRPTSRRCPRDDDPVPVARSRVPGGLTPRRGLRVASVLGLRYWITASPTGC
jgi:hypothetical protein